MQTDWTRAFEQTHGRPLRVLHIGNIANNAYINAKIQRRIGIDADVCCYDYFHIMGCPEWEDAEFEGDVKDQFFPDWWNVDLRGFERPRWFAQGRQRTCIRYLLALRRGDDRMQRMLWWQLRFELWLRCRSTWSARILSLLVGVARGTVGPRPALPGRPERWTLEAFLEWIPLAALWCGRAALFLSAWLRWRLRAGVSRGVRLTAGYTASVARTAGRKSLALVTASAALARGRGWRTASLIVFPRRLSRVARTEEHHAMVKDAIAANMPPVAATVDAVAARWNELFPGDDRLRVSDYAPFLGGVPAWAELFSEYDIVQGYALDPLLPLLAGFRNFVAYEHGTLRDLPFENTPRGRLCALSYRAASTVFVTNSDVIPSARRLGLEESQVVYLPHAVDSNRLLTFAAENGDLRPEAGDHVVFISPTRHDWVDGDPLWAKGNDRLIRALALVRDAGLQCHLILFDWGRHTEESKALVRDLGLTKMVNWQSTLRKRALWRCYMGAHAVVDQFMTPAMGSIAFESLALGCRVLTSLDRPTVEEFFGEMPPILNCREPEEIAAAMVEIIEDPLDTAGVGLASRQWFERFHSTERILDLELQAYARVLSRAADDGAPLPPLTPISSS